MKHSLHIVLLVFLSVIFGLFPAYAINFTYSTFDVDGYPITGDVTGINNSGIIVGNIYTPGGGNLSGFIKDNNTYGIYNYVGPGDWTVFRKTDNNNLVYGQYLSNTFPWYENTIFSFSYPTGLKTNPKISVIYR